MSSVDESLTKVLDGRYTLTRQLDLAQPHKFIIFSDLHMGGGDTADEFRKCKTAFVTAIKHYLARGFTLILLGDIEELWENYFHEIERVYREVLQVIGTYPPDRYLRVRGNHDELWFYTGEVDENIGRYMPTKDVYEALLFEVSNEGKPLGNLLMLHGHQGLFFSDILSEISSFFVRIFRYIQNLTGIGRQTPATDVCLRSKVDTDMYKWAVQQENLILIAGHTHRPVWNSKTHLQKLEEELEILLQAADTPENRARIEAKKAEIAERAAKYPPCDDTEKDCPCYFNTGCCKYDDGDITGIELQDGVLSLIKWSSKTQERTVFEEEHLKTIYRAIEAC